MPDDPQQPTRLFVYGTLMPGHGNHHRIERHVRHARPGRIQGVLVDLGAYPALVPGDGVVDGIVLDIGPAALVITDRIEGYAPNRRDCLYLRKEVTVTHDDGTQTTAWTYEFSEPRRIDDQPRLTAKEVGGDVVHSWPAR